MVRYIHIPGFGGFTSSHVLTEWRDDIALFEANSVTVGPARILPSPVDRA